MLSGEKVLITGAAGRVAFPISRELAKNNEVYGMARFSKPEDRDRLESVGVKCIRKDVGLDSFDDLPDDFTYVFHAGAVLGMQAVENQAYAFEANAQGTGRLMKHCRTSKGFVYCSTASTYKHNPGKPSKETDPQGLHIHNYSLSKIAGEAVVKFISAEMGIPATIIRIFSTYGPEGGAPADRLDAVVEGREIHLHPDKPNYFSPIHEDDYVHHGIKSLLVAISPALVVNWGGSDRVSIEEYTGYVGQLIGREPRIVYSDKAYYPISNDSELMDRVLGPTKVPWKDGFRSTLQARHPNLSIRDVD